MKLQILFLVTHSVAALTIAAACVGGFQAGGAMPMFGAGFASLIVLAAASWYTSARVRDGLASLETVVADHEKSQSVRTGLDEFDQAATRIGACAARWESVAANTRHQAQEFQAMMTLLNRRGASGDASSEQLRGVLAGLGSMIHNYLTQIEQGTSDIQQYAKSITDGAEAQGHAVIKTTAYVEQLSSTIDSVSTNAAAARTAMERTGQSTAAALEMLQQLNEGMNRVRTESQNCEKKLRGLCDPNRQISAIVGTISDIAARTDLLALNASIESIRAGEHGRGFAIVAEEVRQLAEQATDATREIANLLDSMQLVTQESIRGIVREREQVESEAERAAAAQKTLQKVFGDCGNDVRFIQQIAESSAQQLQVAQDVVLAVEQISTIAKSNRGGAENVGWSMKSLGTPNPQLAGIVDRLRKCGEPSAIEFDGTADAVTPPALPTVTMPTPQMVPVG